jgi:hypothetical protein
MARIQGGKEGTAQAPELLPAPLLPPWLASARVPQDQPNTLTVLTSVKSRDGNVARQAITTGCAHGDKRGFCCLR